MEGDESSLYQMSLRGAATTVRYQLDTTLLDDLAGDNHRREDAVALLDPSRELLAAAGYPDWFQTETRPGQTLAASLSFDGSYGRPTLALFDATGAPLVPQRDGAEGLQWTNQTEETATVFLRIVLSQTTGCAGYRLETWETPPPGR